MTEETENLALLSVTSNFSHNDKYVLTIEHGKDYSISLDVDEAIAYANNVVNVCINARYESAITKFHTKELDLKPVDVVPLIMMLRVEREEIKWKPPFSFHSVVSSVDFSPRVSFSVNREVVAQNSPENFEAHAIDILRTVHEAKMANRVYDLFVTKSGFTPEVIKSMISGIANYIDN